MFASKDEYDMCSSVCIHFIIVGTVVVNPEPVDDSDSKPKSAKKRQKGSSMSMSVGEYGSS